MSPEINQLQLHFACNVTVFDDVNIVVSITVANAKTPTLQSEFACWIEEI